MTKTLSEFEVLDMKDLKALINAERFQLPFGPSALQRELLIGYHKAASLIQSGIKEGVLYIPDNAPHLVAFKK